MKEETVRDELCESRAGWEGGIEDGWCLAYPPIPDSFPGTLQEGQEGGKEVKWARAQHGG